MKRRLKPLFCLLIAAVFLLPAAMSPSVVSSNAEAVPRDVLDIIDKVYAAEPGTFPEDEVSEEDWRRVINEGGQAGADLIEYLAEHASVREVESGYDEKSDGLNADYTPCDYSVGYDCITQTETIVDNSEITRTTEEMQAVPRDVLDIIDKVYAAEPGTFPEDEVSEEDWCRVIDEGGKAGEDLVDYLARNASVREIESLDENDERFDDLDSDYTPSDSVSYDCITQTEAAVDNSEITRRTEESQSRNDNFETDKQTSISINEDYIPKAWPDYWHEENPQIYSNTRSTFRLTYSINGKQYIGSAFKIGPYHLGTAGHNLYEPSSGEWAGRITAIPSCRSASPQRPYGTAYSEYMEVGGYWYNSGDATDDWGVIEVDRNTVPDQMTLMSVGDNTSLNGQFVRGQGYPGDMWDTMWLVRGKVTRTGRRLVRVDRVYGYGMSGGPVLNADENRIIGIVRGDTGEFVKFDNWIYNKMNSYR